MAEALAGDHDKSASRRLDRVPSLDIDGAIAADDLPIGAAGQDSACQLRSIDRAADDADHPSLAIWRAAEIGDGLELGMNRENRLLAQHRKRSVGRPTYGRGPFDPADGQP